MTLRLVALRLLMCLALVLNGSGSVMAATQMGLSHAIASASHASVPCHEGARTRTLQAHAAVSSDCIASAAKPAMPDCCDASQCSCDCLQHASATMPRVVVLPGTPAQVDIAPSMHTGHVPPLLPNLLRPPIA